MPHPVTDNIQIPIDYCFLHFRFESKGEVRQPYGSYPHAGRCEHLVTTQPHACDPISLMVLLSCLPSVTELAKARCSRLASPSTRCGSHRQPKLLSGPGSAQKYQPHLLLVTTIVIETRKKCKCLPYEDGGSIPIFYC